MFSLGACIWGWSWTGGSFSSVLAVRGRVKTRCRRNYGYGEYLLVGQHSYSISILCLRRLSTHLDRLLLRSFHRTLGVCQTLRFLRRHAMVPIYYVYVILLTNVVPHNYLTVDIGSFWGSLENWYYRILIIMTGTLQNARIAVDSLSIW